MLLGIRADGQQVGVNGMNDGTRDKLYLVLSRLAGHQDLISGRQDEYRTDFFECHHNNSVKDLGLRLSLHASSRR